MWSSLSSVCVVKRVFKSDSPRSITINKWVKLFKFIYSFFSYYFFDIMSVLLFSIIGFNFLLSLAKRIFASFLWGKDVFLFEITADFSIFILICYFGNYIGPDSFSKREQPGMIISMMCGVKIFVVIWLNFLIIFIYR